MRSAIVAVVAFALVNPNAVSAGTAENARATATEQAAKKREHTVRVRKLAKKFRTKAKAAQPAAPAENPQGARDGKSAAPLCSTPQSGEIARRCLRLAQPTPPPTPASTFLAPAAPATPPFAAPSRSWLGAASKILIVELVNLAENYYLDQTSWQVTMAEEVQWELQHTRLKQLEASRLAAGAPARKATSLRRMAGL